MPDDIDLALAMRRDLAGDNPRTLAQIADDRIAGEFASSLGAKNTSGTGMLTEEQFRSITGQTTRQAAAEYGRSLGLTGDDDAIIAQMKRAGTKVDDINNSLDNLVSTKQLESNIDNWKSGPG